MAARLAAERPITTRDLLTFTFGFGMVTEMFMAPRPWPVVVAADALRLATIVLTQRMFETPETPPVHRDIQEAAYAALA